MSRPHPVGPEYGHRSEALRVELLDINDEVVKTLDTVKSARLDGNWDAQILWGGKMTLNDPGDIDWLLSRVKIWYGYIAQGETEMRWHPRGIFIPATPTGTRVEGQDLRDVELYDKTQVFKEDVVPTTYIVEAGEQVVFVVKRIIAEVEGQVPNIVDYEDTVRVTMSWKPGTTKLQIINDLLASMNMMKIQMDGDGNLFSVPERLLEDTPSWVFRDSQYEGLYLDGWDDEEDLYSVPNRWVGWTRSDGDSEPLYSSAENHDPDSRFSFQARGRWVTRVTEDVDTTSQAKLDAVIQGNLSRATNLARKITIVHPWLPILLYDFVEFHNEERDIHVLARVENIEETLTVPGVTQKTELIVEEYL